MGTTYQVLLNRRPADPAFYTDLGSLDVEENVDLPAALQIRLPVHRTNTGDLSYVNKLGPLTSIAVVVTIEGQDRQCIFDGFVLSHKLHLETGVTGSTLEI